MRRRVKPSRNVAKRQRRKMSARPKAPKATRARNPVAAGKETDVTRLRRELKEAREQQTATSEVLKIISSSPGDMKPVFEAMLANALRICEAKFGTINFFDGDQFRVVAEYNVPPAFTATRLRQGPFRPHPSRACSCDPDQAGRPHRRSHRHAALQPR